MSEGIPTKRNQSGTPENESHFLKQFEAPAITAFNKLRTDIESGAFGSIIGVDGSGRVPALLAREVMRIVYEQKDKPAPSTRFFAGRADWKLVQEHLMKHPP